MSISSPDSLRRLAGLAAGQVFLVVMAAWGRVDYFEVLFAYAVEIEIALLVSLVFFSSTPRMVIRRVLSLLLRTIFLGMLMLWFYVLYHGSKDSQYMDEPISGLWHFLLPLGAYCCVHFCSVLIAARDSGEGSAHAWFCSVVVPELPLWFVFLILIFASNLMFKTLGYHEGPVSTHIFKTTVLILITGSARVLFTWLFTELLLQPDQIESEFRKFMDHRSLIPGGFG